MKKLFTIIIAVTLIAFIATAADAKLSKKDLAEMKAKLEKLNRIEKAKPVVKVEDIKVYIDKDNHIFVKDTANVELKLADYEYEGAIKLRTKVLIEPKPEVKPFSSNFGVAYGVTPKNKDAYKADRGKIVITFAPVEYKKVSAELVLNLDFYGLGAGYRIARNTKIIGAAVVRYGDKINKDNIMPFVGIGLNF